MHEVPAGAACDAGPCKETSVNALSENVINRQGEILSSLYLLACDGKIRIFASFRRLVRLYFEAC